MEARVTELLRSDPRPAGLFGKQAPRQIVAVRLVSDWEIAQHAYSGAPLYRWFDAVAIWRDGNDCEWTQYRFYQRHMGGGSYGPLDIKATVGKEDNATDCKTAAPAPTPAVAAATAAPAAFDVDAIVDGVDGAVPAPCRRLLRAQCRAIGGTAATPDSQRDMCRSAANNMEQTSTHADAAKECQAVMEQLEPSGTSR